MKLITYYKSLHVHIFFLAFSFLFFFLFCFFYIFILAVYENKIIIKLLFFFVFFSSKCWIFVAALLIKEISLALVNCTQFLLFVQNLRLNARCEWGNVIRLLKLKLILNKALKQIEFAIETITTITIR